MKCRYCIVYSIVVINMSHKERIQMKYRRFICVITLLYVLAGDRGEQPSDQYVLANDKESNLSCYWKAFPCQGQEANLVLTLLSKWPP